MECVDYAKLKSAIADELNIHPKYLTKNIVEYIADTGIYERYGAPAAAAEYVQLQRDLVNP